jgi:hypothetical protein
VHGIQQIVRGVLHPAQALLIDPLERVRSGVCPGNKGLEYRRDEPPGGSSTGHLAVADISESLLGGHAEEIRRYLVVFKKVSVHFDSLLEVYLFTCHFKFICMKHPQGPAILLGRKVHVTQLGKIANPSLKPSVQQLC